MGQPTQAELDFAGGDSDGLSAWQAGQRRQREELARQLALPLGRPVEVWLRGGVRLRGELRLAEAFLVHAQVTQENTRFEVAGTQFAFREMESCVQL